MNYITITKLQDFQKILDESIYISGNSSLIDLEIQHNMWVLGFSTKLIKKLNLKDVKSFISALLQKRATQLSLINEKLRAKFYLWFDEQALQLRFNIISHNNTPLPFGCKINVLDSPDTILQNFITIGRHVASESIIVDVLDANEEPSNNNDNEDEIEKQYILDVYVRVISPNTK